MTNWLFEIKGIENLLQKESTVESTLNLCKKLVKELNIIKHTVDNKIDFEEEDKSYIYYTLVEIISNFDFLKDLLNRTIPECEWKDYDFDIYEREEMFNDYLNDLYDLADNYFTLHSGKIIKFLWVG